MLSNLNLSKKARIKKSCFSLLDNIFLKILLKYMFRGYQKNFRFSQPSEVKFEANP